MLQRCVFSSHVYADWLVMLLLSILGCKMTFRATEVESLKAKIIGQFSFK